MRKIIFFLFFFFTINAYAEVKIVATVANKAILNTDIDRKLTVLEHLSHGKNNLTRKDILTILINERLYEYEAKRLQINISTVELDNALHEFRKNNHMNIKKYATKYNLDYDSLLMQIKSSLLFRKIIKKEFLPTVRISTEEINEEREMLANSLNSKITMITLQALTVPATKLTSVQKLLHKNTLEKIAQKFHYRFDNLVWIPLLQLNNKANSYVSKMHKGMLSQPIHLGNEYTIFKLLDKEQVEKSFLDSRVKLKLATINNMTNIQQTLNKQEILVERVSNLQPSIQKALAHMKTGENKIIKDKNIAVKLVSIVPDRLPSRDDLRARLYKRKLLIQVKSYFDELRVKLVSYQ